MIHIDHINCSDLGIYSVTHWTQ